MLQDSMLQNDILKENTTSYFKMYHLLANYIGSIISSSLPQTLGISLHLKS